MSVYIPQITRETSSGFIKDTIQESVFQNHREILCVGEINAEHINALMLQMRYLHSQSSDEEITLYINSPGGSVADGLALYDIVQAISCPVRTVCIGLAASMETREITAKIIANHTGKMLKEIYKITEQDTYFDAEQAVAFGLADRIITEM